MASDPKPQKRIVDTALMRRMHLELQGEPCDLCEVRIGSQLHHVKYRSRGGDDSRENLLWICDLCSLDHGSLPSRSRYQPT